jgi:sugar phosphate isomerase/epimerase
MTQRRCPYCQQVLPEFRLGVRFPNGVKSEIFDLVQRSGIDGIACDTVHAIVFGSREHQPATKTLKAHVNQINELIEDTGYRIHGRGGNYRLINRNARKPYDANDDIRKSVIEGFRAIRARKAAGGRGWPP